MYTTRENALYLASELARYALSEFERGLEGVTDDEAGVTDDDAGATLTDAGATGGDAGMSADAGVVIGTDGGTSGVDAGTGRDDGGCSCRAAGARAGGGPPCEEPLGWRGRQGPGRQRPDKKTPA